MKLMICMQGEPEQLDFLAEIAELGAGIELGSYGLIGIQSAQSWDRRISQHKALRERFDGPLAIHGPFIGIEYAHVDHLIRDAVRQRLDMIFEVAVTLKASRVVLHSGYRIEYDYFNLRDFWLELNTEFWRREIHRWADQDISIVIENNTEKRPDLLVSLVSEVNNPYLGLCLDIGHQNVFSDQDAVEWVRKMDRHLFHVHLHDNDGLEDQHLPVGSGTIDFKPFYETLMQNVPGVTISLEVESDMATKMDGLRKLAAFFK